MTEQLVHFLFPTPKAERDLLAKLASSDGQEAVVITSGEREVALAAMQRAHRGDRLAESVAATRHVLFAVDAHSCATVEQCRDDFENDRLAPGDMCPWQASQIMGYYADDDSPKVSGVNGELLAALVAYTLWPAWAVAMGSIKLYRKRFRSRPGGDPFAYDDIENVDRSGRMRSAS
jgi:hypothetical protein